MFLFNTSPFFDIIEHIRAHANQRDGAIVHRDEEQGTIESATGSLNLFCIFWKENECDPDFSH